MALQRHNGTGWVEARATYTLFDKRVPEGEPAIWLRARRIWRVTGGVWTSTPAGNGETADIDAIHARTWGYTSDGIGMLDPGTSDPIYNYETRIRITPGANCHAYVLWSFDAASEEPMWLYFGSFSCTPGISAHHSTDREPTRPRNKHWCVTAFTGGADNGELLPTDQQGFSRFMYG